MIRTTETRIENMISHMKESCLSLKLYCEVAQEIEKECRLEAQQPALTPHVPHPDLPSLPTPFRGPPQQESQVVPMAGTSGGGAKGARAASAPFGARDEPTSKIVRRSGEEGVLRLDE